MVICVTSFDKLRRHLMVTVLSSYWNWRSPERLINNRLRHVISSQQTISKRLSVDTQKKSIEWENPLINLPAGCRPIRRWARDGVPSNMKEPIAIRTLNHWIQPRSQIRKTETSRHLVTICPSAAWHLAGVRPSIRRATSFCVDKIELPPQLRPDIIFFEEIKGAAHVEWAT